VRANFLASPPLVVAYALKGTVTEDMYETPIGEGTNGPVFLKDIWPTNLEIADLMAANIDDEMFRAAIRTSIWATHWQGITVEGFGHLFVARRQHLYP
jgi:aconitate hydratase